MAVPDLTGSVTLCVLGFFLKMSKARLHRGINTHTVNLFSPSLRYHRQHYPFSLLNHGSNEF